MAKFVTKSFFKFTIYETLFFTETKRSEAAYQACVARVWHGALCNEAARYLIVLLLTLWKFIFELLNIFNVSVAGQFTRRAPGPKSARIGSGALDNKAVYLKIRKLFLTL